MMLDSARTTANGEAESLDDLSYEEGYARLQEVLEALESDGLPLEESLRLYEMGTRLAAHCARKLEAAELCVRRWQDGDETIPFEGWEADTVN